MKKGWPPLPALATICTLSARSVKEAVREKTGEVLGAAEDRGLAADSKSGEGDFPAGSPGGY